MDNERLQYYREKLQVLRAELIDKLQSRYKDAIDLGKDTGLDSADEAYNIYSRNIMLGRVETDALKLQLVEQAFKRIEANVYGTCIECEEEIEQRRLEYVPFARYCTDCKSELEKKGVIKM